MADLTIALALCDKDLEYALKLSARTIDEEDGNATYLDTYAWVLHRLGRNDEAKRIMQQALSIDGQRTATLLHNRTFLRILELFNRYSPCTCGNSLTVLCCGEFNSCRGAG